jgi:2,4-dienoyl-CoA reductase-like NADH-dependent reductase (Old Yellow Enzyme family)
MVEIMAPSHDPDDTFSRVYSQWGGGGWGLILTGTSYSALVIAFVAISLLSCHLSNVGITLGNVQVTETYLGSSGDVAITGPRANPLAIQTAWRNWATATQKEGTPALVQLCHPGRQSPIGAGTRSLLTKNLAPSPVAMNIESGCLARVTTNVMFGTPREMTHAEIIETIQQFIDGARQAYPSGFKGVELHGAHGYLIAQFLSPKVNLRTDEFGGTPAKRAEIVLRIIEGIRTTTSPQFCVGIKMNSVDVSEQGDGGLDACLEQMGLVVEAGIDFIEISGGSFENFSFLAVDPPADAMTPPAGLPIRKKSTIEREAYFLDFAKKVRKRYPEVPLMVTGGFRSRTAMEAALKGGACDIIGIGRPATMVPALPIDWCYSIRSSAMRRQRSN